MKLKFHLHLACWSLGVAALLLPIQGAENVDGPRTTTKSFDRERSLQPILLGQVVRASDAIGREVLNRKGEKLGRIEDIAVDIETGRIIQLLISSGGVLGVGDRLVAVPPTIFACEAPHPTLRLDVSAQVMKSAPAVELSKWDESTQYNRVVDGYRYFGIEPPFAYGARADSRAARFPDSVERASKVIGAAVRNETDEKLGRVDNLMVDIQAGRIVHVVVSSGGFLGVGDELRAIPPSVCRYRETDNLVIVNASKDVVLHAPQLKAGEWTNLNDAAYSARVYRAYQVEPYFTLDADPARRQVRDRDVRAITPQERSLTPLDQGNSEEDIDLTRRIRKEIMELPDLSVNARNIKIITANGRVTLRGPVSSAAEKRTLEVLARRIASPEQVESQLEIKEPADR